MKTCTLMTLVLVAGVMAGPGACLGGPGMLEPGTINFREADVHQVLDVYKCFVRIEFITDSRVKNVQARITAKNESAISEAQAAEFVEKALLEQAGIVISRLDANRASVTYNDALPIVLRANGESALSRDVPSVERQPLVMYYFGVDTNSFFLNLKSRIKPGSSQPDVDLLREYFRQQGINVSPPFSICHKAGTGDLLINPGKEDVGKIEQLMKQLQTGR